MPTTELALRYDIHGFSALLCVDIAYTDEATPAQLRGALQDNQPIIQALKQFHEGKKRYDKIAENYEKEIMDDPLDKALSSIKRTLTEIVQNAKATTATTRKKELDLTINTQHLSITYQVGLNKAHLIAAKGQTTAAIYRYDSRYHNYTRLNSQEGKSQIFACQAEDTLIAITGDLKQLAQQEEEIEKTQQKPLSITSKSKESSISPFNLQGNKKITFAVQGAGAINICDTHLQTHAKDLITGIVKLRYDDDQMPTSYRVELELSTLLKALQKIQSGITAITLVAPIHNGDNYVFHISSDKAYALKHSASKDFYKVTKGIIHSRHISISGPLVPGDHYHARDVTIDYPEPIVTTTMHTVNLEDLTLPLSDLQTKPDDAESGANGSYLIFPVQAPPQPVATRGPGNPFEEPLAPTQDDHSAYSQTTYSYSGGGGAAATTSRQQAMSPIGSYTQSNIAGVRSSTSPTVKPVLDTLKTYADLGASSKDKKITALKYCLVDSSKPIKECALKTDIEALAAKDLIILFNTIHKAKSNGDELSYLFDETGFHGFFSKQGATTTSRKILTAIKTALLKKYTNGEDIYNTDFQAVLDKPTGRWTHGTTASNEKLVDLGCRPKR